jgi:hypothetical protein
MARGPKKGANPAQNIKPGYLVVRTNDVEPVGIIYPSNK